MRDRYLSGASTGPSGNLINNVSGGGNTFKDCTLRNEEPSVLTLNNCVYEERILTEADKRGT